MYATGLLTAVERHTLHGPTLSQEYPSHTRKICQELARTTKLPAHKNITMLSKREAHLQVFLEVPQEYQSPLLVVNFVAYHTLPDIVELGQSGVGYVAKRVGVWCSAHKILLHADSFGSGPLRSPTKSTGLPHQDSTNCSHSGSLSTGINPSPVCMHQVSRGHSVSDLKAPR